MFESPWLRNTEKELKECLETLQSSTDPDTRASMDALREVIQDKLANHHRNLGTLRCQEALNERKRVCRALGLLSKEDDHLGASLTEPLPLASAIHTFSEEDEGIFSPPKRHRTSHTKTGNCTVLYHRSWSQAPQKPHHLKKAVKTSGCL